MDIQVYLDSVIRKVPGFPKPGILFYDITSVLTHPEAFAVCVHEMKKLYAGRGIDRIAAVEARGFLFAAPLARELDLPLVLIRKKGKLPGKTVSRTFTLEYGEDEIQMHEADVEKGDSILIVDDLIATGGTLKAAVELIEETECRVAGIFGVIGLPFLNYSEILSGYEVQTLINYSSES